MNKYQIDYLCVWKAAFKAFLGWTDAQTMSWAKPWLERLDPPGMVLNDPPMYYVAQELAYMQEYYDQLSPVKKEHLIREAQLVLTPDLAQRSFPPGFNFSQARAKMKQLFIESAPK